MSRVHLVSLSVAALLVAAGAAACAGGRAGERVVVRVGDAAISEGNLAHWMSVFAPEHLVPDPPRYRACVARERALAAVPDQARLERECRQQYTALKAQALDFLISSQWLLGEAQQRGLKVSSREAKQRAEQQPPPQLVNTSSPADVSFAVSAELAAAKLHQMLSASEQPIAPAALAAYYRAHRRQFLIPERRYFDIVNLHSQAAAIKVKGELEAGKSIASVGLHESIERPTNTSYSPEEQAARRAIFAARPNVLTGPVMVQGDHSLFEVKRIAPARLEPLARVRSSIAARLAAEQQQRTLTRFIEAWRHKWIAVTSCRPTYVVQKCSQYRGPRPPEPLAVEWEPTMAP